MAARQSIVLLKNHNKDTNLKSQVNSIFVTGPSAANTDILLGNYHGLNGSMVTLIEGIVSRAPEGMMIKYQARLSMDCSPMRKQIIGQLPGSRE